MCAIDDSVLIALSLLVTLSQDVVKERIRPEMAWILYTDILQSFSQAAREAKIKDLPVGTLPTAQKIIYRRRRNSLGVLERSAQGSEPCKKISSCPSEQSSRAASPEKSRSRSRERCSSPTLSPKNKVYGHDRTNRQFPASEFDISDSSVLHQSALPAIDGTQVPTSQVSEPGLRRVLDPLEARGVPRDAATLTHAASRSVVRRGSDSALMTTGPSETTPQRSTCRPVRVEIGHRSPSSSALSGRMDGPSPPRLRSVHHIHSIGAYSF